MLKTDTKPFLLSRKFAVGDQMPNLVSFMRFLVYDGDLSLFQDNP